MPAVTYGGEQSVVGGLRWRQLRMANARHRVLAFDPSTRMVDGVPRAGRHWPRNFSPAPHVGILSAIRGNFDA
jgi:hypothetical protein